VKFYDYFESIGVSYDKEFEINTLDTNYEKLICLMEDNKHLLLPNQELLNKKQEELLKSCPFNKGFFKRFFL